MGKLNKCEMFFKNNSTSWDGDYLPGTYKRLRSVVADAMRDQAKNEQRSMAVKIYAAAFKVETGGRLTLKVHDAIGRKRWEAIKGYYIERCKKEIGLIS